MKKWPRLLAGMLMASLLVTGVSAHSHPGDVEPDPTVSPWAQEEVAEAEDLGLIPEGLPSDYRAPITRAQFRMVGMQYLAAQLQYDVDILQAMAARFVAGYDDLNRIIPYFSDGSDADQSAYYLGLVKGYEDKTFQPDRFITRQEAAVLLTQAYSAIGGALPEGTIEFPYPDAGEVKSWALNSASAVTEWGVMNGVALPTGETIFSPNGDYTIQQCIITFLRLWKNAPVSRDKGNVTPRFTVEQGMEYITNPFRSTAAGFTESLRVEGEGVTFLRMELSGVMQRSSYMYFLHDNGGVMRVDLGICQNGGIISPDLALKNPRFSEDGKQFLCTVTLESDTLSPGDGRVIHEKGTYDIVVDAMTGKPVRWTISFPEETAG